MSAKARRGARTFLKSTDRLQTPSKTDPFYGESMNFYVSTDPYIIPPTRSPRLSVGTPPTSLRQNVSLIALDALGVSVLGAAVQAQRWNSVELLGRRRPESLESSKGTYSL